MVTLKDFFHKLENCQLSKVRTAHEFEIWKERRQSTGFTVDSNPFNTDTKGAVMSVPVMQVSVLLAREPVSINLVTDKNENIVLKKTGEVSSETDRVP